MKCEICNSSICDIVLDDNNSLQQCTSCGYTLRNLKRCPANYRTHPWGGDSFFDKIRNSITLKQMNKVLKIKKKNVFEIGFGSGWLLEQIYKNGNKITGIEAEMLDIPVSRIVKEQGTLIYKKIENLESNTNGQFDLVFGIHLIEHLTDPKTVFEKCFSLLNNKGSLYFITPNIKSKGLNIFKSAWWNLEDPSHIRFYSPKSIMEQLKACGFKNVEVKPLPLDSLLVEVNSFLRLGWFKTKEHGVMNNYFAKIISLILLPIFLTIRFIYKPICPSMEIIAKK